MLGCAATCLFGCKPVDVSEAFEFAVRVEADPGQPLADVEISVDGVDVAKSPPDGVTTLSAPGRAGEMRQLQVRCPAGFRAPVAPVVVTLRKNLESERRPEYLLRCAPLLRTLVVAVRADNGPNLPVKYLGREVARTDRAGAAHFVLRAAPEDVLEIQLDTTAHPELRPRQPSARFRVAARDEIFVFNSSLHAEHRAVRAPRALPVDRPVQIGSRG